MNMYLLVDLCIQSNIQLSCFEFSISCFKLWSHLSTRAAFNKSSVSHNLCLTFKSDAMPGKLFSFALTLRGLLCLELSDSVAKGMSLPWNNAEGMCRCVHSFFPGGTGRQWQLLVGLGSLGELYVHPLWSQHPAHLLILARMCSVLKKMLVQRAVRGLTGCDSM